MATQPSTSAFPAMSMEQVRSALTAPGSKFEMETVTVHGVPTRVWKNAPPTLAALVRLSRTHGERLATIHEDERVSFEAQYRAVAALATDLAAHGVGKGDRVAIAMRNLPEWPVAFFATVVLGAIAVPLNAWWTGEELAYGLADSGACVLICDEERWARIAPHRAELPALTRILVSRAAHSDAERLEAVIGTPRSWAALPAAELPAVDLAPDDDASILYTSGTTGKPKGAEGSHLSLVEQVNVLLVSAFDIRADDVVLGALPLFHTFGQTCAMNVTFRAGARLVMVPKFDGPTALATMVAQQATIMTGVPTMYMALLEAARADPDQPMPPLRYGTSGGAPIPLAVIDAVRETFGIEVYEGYGLTETSPVATFNPVGVPPRPGTVGTAIWGVDVEAADPEETATTALLPRGELGELVIRGHNLFTGYLNRPEATAQAVVDGWFRTGDLGTVGEDGYVTIVDRTKDMILRNGYNVYPREVEEILARHPDVARVAVFGLPDATHGEEVAAAVVLAPGATADAAALLAYASEQLGAHKYPRRYEIVDSLPLGPSGKVLKRELVARYS